MAPAGWSDVATVTAYWPGFASSPLSTASPAVSPGITCTWLEIRPLPADANTGDAVLMFVESKNAAPPPAFAIPKPVTVSSWGN